MGDMQTGKGTATSLFASCLFGLIYYYATLLKPLSGIEIYGWRIVFTLPCLSLFMVAAGVWRFVPDIVARVRQNVLLIAPLAASALLLGVQLWLFMWAPINGMALDVSLGYLLMPLVMVVCGRVVYKERLRRFQQVAVCCAAIGVGNQLWLTGMLSWASLVVAGGFPLYFMLRRKLRTDNLGGLWFDMAFMLPVACIVIARSGSPWSTMMDAPRLFVLLPLLGVLSATATACFMLASRMLPLGLFGLLSYMEPVLLVVVSLLLGESIRQGEALTYIGVGTAIVVLALGGLQSMHKKGRQVR